MAIFLLFEVLLMWIVKVQEFSDFVHTVLDGLQCEALGVGLSASDLFEEVCSRKKARRLLAYRSK